MFLLMSRRRWAGATLTTLLLLPALLAVGCGGGGSSSGVPGDTNGDGIVDEGPSSDPEVCRNYTPRVVVDSITPNRGPVTGGTRITIKGSGFVRCSPSQPTVVLYETGPLQVVSFNDKEIVCDMPGVRSARTVDIRVTVRNPRGYNPNNPPSYEGISGWNEFSEATKFTYE